MTGGFNKQINMHVGEVVFRLDWVNVHVKLFHARDNSEIAMKNEKKARTG